MAYIGKEPVVGNFQVCDAISVVNGQAAYTMQVDSTNVVPESANHMLVSLNGILQKPNSSFTVSGSTITFASNLATGDVIDFIMLLGNVLDIGTPSDSTVTNAKTNFVSTSSGAGLSIKGDGTTDGTLQLNCSQNSHGIKLKSPPHSAGQSYTLTFPSTAPATDKVLQTDSSGNLSFADAGGGGTALVSTSDVTSYTSNIVVDGIFSSSYRNYLIIGNLHTETNDQQIELRYRQSSSTVTSSSYRRGWNGNYSTNSSGSSRYDSGNYGGSSISLINNISSTENTGGCYFNMYLYEPLGTDNFKTVTFHSSSESPNSTKSFMNFSGNGLFYGNTTALSGLDFFAQSGNIKGNIKIYGLS